MPEPDPGAQAVRGYPHQPTTASHTPTTPHPNRHRVTIIRVSPPNSDTVSCMTANRPPHAPPDIHTFVAIDLETTGLDPQKDKIIEVGAVNSAATANWADFPAS